jgi:hypothetical protein
VTRDEIEGVYDVAGGVITSEGAFQGAPVWAPYLWDLGLAGLAGEPRPDGSLAFDVTPEHVAEFPELRGLARVVLREDGSGVVGWVRGEAPESGAHAARPPEPEERGRRAPSPAPAEFADPAAVPAPGQRWALAAGGVAHGRLVEVSVVDGGTVRYRDVTARGGLGPERRASIQAFARLYSRPASR